MNAKDIQFLKSPINEQQAIEIATKFRAKTNLAATTAPTVNSDVSQGYSNGSLWYNTTSQRVYICVDNTDGAAVWADLTSTATTGSFQGFWDASTNIPTLADGTGNNGDYYFTSTGGTQDLGSGSITFGAGDMVIYDATVWAKIPAQNLVTSVFGRLGAITAQNGDYTASQVTNVAAGNIVATTVQAAINELDGQDTTITSNLSSHTSNTSNPHSVTKTQVGLGSVDNTSDIDKPVSTAQQTAIDSKVADAINNGTTTIAPSQNAVFDAFASFEQSHTREVPFTNQTSVTVTHNLGFKPKGISVLDLSGNEIIVSIEHINTSSFVTSSNINASGVIIY